MIVISDKPKGLALKDPVNLTPIIFKCKNCSSLVEKNLESSSYYMYKEPKDNNLCTFCNKLTHAADSI